MIIITEHQAKFKDINIIVENNLNISISVDGAIDENTSKKAVECGADILIYGSSLFKDKNIGSTHF